MDAKLESLNRHLKHYDRELYSMRSPSGKISVYRKSYRFDTYDLDGITLSVLRPNHQHIISLTKNWSINGDPVDWGIEPVIQRLRETDQWNHPELYDEFCKERQTRTENEERAQRNEIRAIAADIRRDFAKATNEINTSTLEKVERRRIKDGNCKS